MDLREIHKNHIKKLASTAGAKDYVAGDVYNQYATTNFMCLVHALPLTAREHRTYATYHQVISTVSGAVLPFIYRDPGPITVLLGDGMDMFAESYGPIGLYNNILDAAHQYGGMDAYAYKDYWINRTWDEYEDEEDPTGDDEKTALDAAICQKYGSIQDWVGDNGVGRGRATELLALFSAGHYSVQDVLDEAVYFCPDRAAATLGFAHNQRVNSGILWLLRSLKDIDQVRNESPSPVAYENWRAALEDPAKKWASDPYSPYLASMFPDIYRAAMQLMGSRDQESWDLYMDELDLAVMDYDRLTNGPRRDYAPLVTTFIPAFAHLYNCVFREVHHLNKGSGSILCCILGHKVV